MRISITISMDSISHFRPSKILLLLPEVNVHDINLALRGTKNYKDFGKDCVVTYAIRIGSKCLLRGIGNLFNLCHFNITPPNKCYQEIVILIHKEGDIA